MTEASIGQCQNGVSDAGLAISGLFDHTPGVRRAGGPGGLSAPPRTPFRHRVNHARKSFG